MIAAAVFVEMLGTQHALQQNPESQRFYDHLVKSVLYLGLSVVSNIVYLFWIWFKFCSFYESPPCVFTLSLWVGSSQKV